MYNEIEKIGISTDDNVICYLDNKYKALCESVIEESCCVGAIKIVEIDKEEKCEELKNKFKVICIYDIDDSYFNYLNDIKIKEFEKELKS